LVLDARFTSTSQIFVTRVDEDDFVEQIYQTLHLVHEFSDEGLSYQKERILNLLHSSLPSVRGAGLKVRFRLYLKEEHNEIVRREKIAFINIFSNPTLDLAIIRSFLWEIFCSKREIASLQRLKIGNALPISGNSIREIFSLSVKIRV